MCSIFRASVLLVTATVAPARADGFFYQQSYGVSSARGEAAPMIGESLQLRIAIGWRFGHIQVGPWLGNHLAVHRDGAYYGLVGGEPNMGDSDLRAVGLDGRYNAALSDHLSLYVRGGPRFAEGIKGALAPYEGMGVGAGAGISLTGKVRALGFLGVPFFWSKRGPKVTATLFFDYNVEYLQMRRDGMPDVWMPLLGASIGFGAGSFF